MNRFTTFLISAPLLLCLLVAHTAWGAQAISLTDGIFGAGFSISPDQSRIIFGSLDGLYSARIDGVGAPLRISAPDQSPMMVANGFSPDGSWFVYKSNRYIEEVRHLEFYSARADGSGTPLLLNSSLLPIDPESPDTGAFRHTVAISSDSRQVAMWVQDVQQEGSHFDLLSRPIDASGPVVSLSDGQSVAAFGDQDHGGAAGKQVLFLVNDHPLSELQSRVFDGAAPAKPLGPPVGELRQFTLSPDQSKVVMATDAGTTKSLYIKSVEGGALTLLASAEDEFYFSPQYIGGMKFSPDGSRVTYLKGATIWSVRTDGSSPAVEIVPNRDGWSSWHADISPDSKSIVYTRLPPPDDSIEIFVSPIDGDGPAVSVWGKQDGHIENLRFASDGRHVLFQEFRQDGLNQKHFLWSAPADGSKPAVELGQAHSYQVMPDGQSVIIAPDRNTDWLLDGFYQVPIDGGEPRLVVANPFPAGGIDAFSDWQLIDNGSKIIFVARDGTSHFEIFVASIPEPSSVFAISVMLLLLGRGRREVSRRNELS